MQFGVCTTVEDSPAAKAVGFDFIEVRVDQLIRGEEPDNQWTGAKQAAQTALPIRSANVLIPGTFKITGPEADLARLESYLTTVASRAAGIGITNLVLGSGNARKVPDGFDRGRGQQQMVEFLQMAARVLQKHGITLCVKHLNKNESNIINSVDEAMSYVNKVNHPNIRCVIDTFHMWVNDERPESYKPHVASVLHVNVADRDRGEPSKENYRPLFGVLKQGGYKGPLSVEATNFNVAKTGRQVLEYVKQQWNEA